MPKPKSKRIIVLQSSNHDSGSASLRDAIARSQDESSESGDQDTLTGEDYSEDNGGITFSRSGEEQDILLGGYSEASSVFVNTSITFSSEPDPSPVFTKNLLPQAIQSGKLITIQDLPAQLVERSEKDLQQIAGGVAFGGSGSWEDKRHIPIYGLQQIAGGVAFGGSGSWDDRRHIAIYGLQQIAGRFAFGGSGSWDDK